uniref:Uncharacterized protein n=1 Tax=Oryza glaberrima TaxID=4538 RepID=I1QI88_ORYGL
MNCSSFMVFTASFPVGVCRALAISDEALSNRRDSWKGIEEPEGVHADKPRAEKKRVRTEKFETNAEKIKTEKFSLKQ